MNLKQSIVVAVAFAAVIGICVFIITGTNFFTGSVKKEEVKQIDPSKINQASYQRYNLNGMSSSEALSLCDQSEGYIYDSNPNIPNIFCCDNDGCTGPMSPAQHVEAYGWGDS